MPARLISVALLAACFSVSIQSRPAAAPGDSLQRPPTVDESALRYYAASRQPARVEAEMQRLRRLSPGWQPPRDLWLEELGHDDEEPLWKLFAADQLTELVARIDARSRREPGWTPSRHLAGKLDRKLRRSVIMASGREARWDAVAAEATRLDDEDADPELLWIVAEGLVRVKREEDGQAVLRRILAGSQNPAARIATVQKAFALLSIERAEEIFQLQRPGPDGVGEFAGIAADITRARLAAFLRRERRQPLPADEIALLAEKIRAARDGAGASLLGWYAFARRDDEAALDWFKLAIASGGDAMTAHGLAHSLRRLGYAREAEDVAFAWREPLVQNAILYVDILEVALTAKAPARIEASRLERYARVVTETQSGEGAQALAWYATNVCQDEVALAWFERAVAWFPKETTVVGYANVLRRLKRQREFLQVLNRYDGLFPSVVDLLFQTEEQRSPSPCENPSRQPGAEPAALVADRSGRDGMRAIRPSTGAVPRPPGDPAQDVSRIRRPDFPLPVPAENPRRHGRTADAGSERATAGAWRREPAPRTPLIARRVLGASAMPYEASGLSLLPAYDGTERASTVAVPDWAPAGTLWAEEQVDAKPRAPASRWPAPSPTASTESGSRFVGRGWFDSNTPAGATSWQ